MSGATTLRMKSYIQPFERILALREVNALLGGAASPAAGTEDVWVGPARAARDAAGMLAYWESVGGDYTAQVLREAAGLIAKNGIGLDDSVSLSKQQLEQKIPRSRCLRYGPHGIHEYRGKFFPQLVKALINIAGTREGLILDPMCGSGTTLVEAMCTGHRAVGIDMNPLSVFVSRAKCNVMRIRGSEIVEGFKTLQSDLDATQELLPRPRRAPADDSYLRDWFSAGVLTELDFIAAGIDRLENGPVAELLKVSLSNIIRRVSFQKVEDLRIRREYKRVDASQVRGAFLEEALRSAKMVAADVSLTPERTCPEAKVIEGDARTFIQDGCVGPSSVDLVITSPPYATALPYLDTDRLSLSYLGLLSRAEHRSRDSEMIGNREITEKRRRLQWERYLAERVELPASVRSLVERIERENAGGAVGFRRRNLPALLATYFFDMRDVLAEIQHALKPGGRAYLVVGNNRTKTPRGEVEIRTSELLLELAAALGFTECERLEMEMLRSRDIFRDNRTPSEHILALRRQ